MIERQYFTRVEGFKTSDGIIPLCWIVIADEGNHIGGPQEDARLRVDGSNGFKSAGITPVRGDDLKTLW